MFIYLTKPIMTDKVTQCSTTKLYAFKVQITKILRKSILMIYNKCFYGKILEWITYLDRKLFCTLNEYVYCVEYVLVTNISRT